MRLQFLAACVAILCMTTSAPASQVSVTPQQRSTTAAEVASDPALAGARVFDFFLTSSADVLSISDVTLTILGGTFYQYGGAADNEPPNPILVNAIPALGADSWISTPGGTSSAGGGFSTPQSSWFDSENNGAQNNFQFARLTTSNTFFGKFNFRVSVPNDAGDGVENFSFSLDIPEPASLGMGSMGLMALAAFRRRRAA